MIDLEFAVRFADHLHGGSRVVVGKESSHKQYLIVAYVLVQFFLILNHVNRFYGFHPGSVIIHSPKTSRWKAYL